MKKKIIMLAFLVALISCLFVITVCAKDFDTGIVGTDGKNIVLNTYDEDGDALIWVTREVGAASRPSLTQVYQYVDNGTTYDVSYIKAKDGIVVENGYSITIKTGIGLSTGNIIVLNLDGLTHSDGTGIKSFGFVMQNVTNLRYVYITASMEALKSTGSQTKQVFLGTTNLTEIEFAPNSQIKVLNKSAFKNCALTKIVLPENLETIEQEAFYGCASLKTVYIPKSVTSVNANAFSGVTDATYYFTEAKKLQAHGILREPFIM